MPRSLPRAVPSRRTRGWWWLVPLLAAGAARLLAAPPEPAEELWAAARQGDAAKVAALLAGGVDPNAAFREGGTALIFAAQRGHEQVVRVLLEHGADVQTTETVNRTSALHFAIGHPEVVKLLVAGGADVNARELQNGQAPLWWSVLKNDLPSAGILLASGRVSRLALEEAGQLARKLGRDGFVAAIESVSSGTAEVSRWPQFRGEGAAGVADGEHPPLRFGLDPPANLKWQVTIPGLAHSSPVVWGDRVFVTTAVSGQPETDFHLASPMESAKDVSPHSLRVLCFDRLSGKLLWERTAYSGAPKTKRSPRNSYASPTPATDGRHVVAMFGSHGLYCYTVEGKLLWSQDLGLVDPGFFLDPDYQWGDASSPIVFKNLVIVLCDRQKGSFLAAFDLDTGERRWRVPRDELPSWSTPTLVRGAGRPELVTNGVNEVRGYDPETGKDLWALKTRNSMIAAPTPVSGLGLVVVTNGYRPLKPIYAIRPGATGDISLGDEDANRWVAWSKKAGGAYYITPLIYGEHLYVLSEGGILSNYYLKTGELIYRHRVGESGDLFSSSPVAADGYLFLASEGGEVYVVKDGIEYQLTASNPVGEPCMATPAIAGHMLFVRTHSRLLVFG
ncbi:MAG TPA: PQQ-binding-like beta-propeller repeat protein [Thermoanaerobaculia bacterium]|nr:PQQ-binding-like beta-propeller repeat protein [Thermoanaerobaculia bacterium]